jgi:hypothetical protein
VEKMSKEAQILQVALAGIDARKVKISPARR